MFIKLQANIKSLKPITRIAYNMDKIMSLNNNVNIKLRHLKIWDMFVFNKNNIIMQLDIII